MKEIRLKITDKCDKNCKGCCNNQPQFKEIETLSISGVKYVSKILLTGGEPLLIELNKLCAFIKLLKFTYTESKIILYTALADIEKIKHLLNDNYEYLDGLTFSIHDNKGVEDFIKLNEELQELKRIGRLDNIDFRLNIFTDIKLPVINLYFWKVKFIEWIKDCPLPEHEKFYKFIIY